MYSFVIIFNILIILLLGQTLHITPICLLSAKCCKSTLLKHDVFNINIYVSVCIYVNDFYATIHDFTN